MELERGPAQSLDIEKANRGGCDVAGTKGELSLLKEMVEIGPDVIRGELVGGSPMGRPPVVLGKVGDGFGIGALGAGYQTVQLHLAHHALTQGS